MACAFRSFFYSILVITGRCLAVNERMRSTEPCLRLERFPSLAGLSPENARSVGLRLTNRATGKNLIFKDYE